MQQTDVTIGDRRHVLLGTDSTEAARLGFTWRDTMLDLPKVDDARVPWPQPRNRPYGTAGFPASCRSTITAATNTLASS